MPEIMFTSDGHPIQHVRVVSGSTVMTAGGNPVTAVRVIEPPLWTPGYVFTPSGFPIRAVRLVDAAGAYTTDWAPVATLPEDVFTPDGNTIEAVRIFSSVPSPEVVFTGDGHPIEAVRLIDAAGSPLAFDSDADAWRQAVITSSGTVSAARFAIVQQFVNAEAAGTWALTDDYWGLWGENEIQARTSLKRRVLATLPVAPTFTTDRGYTFDGTTQYIDTGFIPSTHGVQLTATNMRLSAYENIDSMAVGTGYVAGASSTSSARCILRPSNASGFPAFGLNCTSTTVGTVPTNRGYTVASRTGVPVFEVFKNGISLGTAVPTTTAAIASTHSIYIGGINNVGALGSQRATRVGFISVGGSLSAAQETAAYSNVQAMAASIGAT